MLGRLQAWHDQPIDRTRLIRHPHLDRIRGHSSVMTTAKSRPRSSLNHQDHLLLHTRRPGVNGRLPFLESCTPLQGDTFSFFYLLVGTGTGISCLPGISIWLWIQQTLRVSRRATRFAMNNNNVSPSTMTNNFAGRKLKAYQSLHSFQQYNSR